MTKKYMIREDFIYNTEKGIVIINY